MKIAYANSSFQQVVGEVFRHLFRQSGNEDALVLGGSFPDFCEEVIDLSLGGFDDYFGVDEPGGANNLFDYLPMSCLKFEGAGGGGHVDGLPNACFEFVKGEWPVVEC